MFKRQLVILSLITSLLLMLAPVHAQDGTLNEADTALLSLILGAFENTLSQDSFTVISNTTTDQISDIANIGEVSQSSTQSQTTQVKLSDGSYEFYIVLMQSNITTMSGIEQPPAESTFEFLLQDDQFYMRIGDENSPMAAIFPTGWFTDEEGGIPSLMASVFTALATPEALGIYNLPEQSIVTIEELPSEEIDGQVMHVLELEIDFQIFVESGILGSLLDPNTFGGDTPIDTNFDNAAFSYKVWIGADDNLLHQVISIAILDEVVIEVLGQTTTVSMVSATTSTYGNYNEAVEFPSLDL